MLRRVTFSWAFAIVPKLRTTSRCGRFTFQPTEAAYARFQLSNRLDALTARYHIAPGQMLPGIIAQSPRHIVLMR